MLERLLASLERQTLPADQFEVLVIPSPDDPGVAVVEARAAGPLDLRWAEIPNDPSGGRSPSLKRNHGASLARGDVLAFTDDDCEVDPAWLAAGWAAFEAAPDLDAVEGRTVVPTPERATLMSKLLQHLTRPGGYQTCNVLYRRARFQELGGFDPALPFYLEDTDLAWSLLDRGGRIETVPEAIVAHPVKAADPWQIWRDAVRVRQVPYLFRKHPEQFRAEGYRALTRSHWVYLILYAALASALAAQAWVAVGCLAGAWGALLLLHATRLFWGCRFGVGELVLTTALLPVVPIVRLGQLWRGNLEQRVWLWT